LVKQLQGYLCGIAYFEESGHELKSDGFYGQKTTAAVVHFQRNQGLEPTGRTDVTTWNKVVEVYRSYINQTHDPVYLFPTECESLRPGDSGIAVYAAQMMLCKLSEKYSVISHPEPCGIFTAETERAVKTFQKLLNIKENGCITPALWNLLTAASKIF